MSHTTAAPDQPTGNEIASYRADLQHLPRLVPGVSSEHTARTPWIGGIHINDHMDPNTTVRLHRWADAAEDGLQAEISYEVQITNDSGPIYLTIEAAQLLGAALLQAAATATWDLVDNAEFLAGHHPRD